MSQTIIINQINYTLPQLEKDCWHRLLNGAVKGRDPMHYITLATQASGNIGLRTVVLRKTVPATKTIIFHTDKRSPKCTEMADSPLVSVLLYDHPAKIQLRLTARAIIQITGAPVNEAWQQTNLSSRRSYLTMLPPSSGQLEAASGLPPKVDGSELTMEESEAGRQNFAVVTLQVLSIDWLHLGAAGHRRAFFTYDSSGTLTGQQWLVP